jgi:hypothetical protein
MQIGTRNDFVSTAFNFFDVQRPSQVSQLRFATLAGYFRKYIAKAWILCFVTDLRINNNNPNRLDLYARIIVRLKLFLRIIYVTEL